MFSLKVVDTDDFLDMPPTTQNLYFHLAMRADDDGFVNSPKKIMKIVNSPEDDLKILITKQFILPFQSGVIVIRHWKENNYIRSDRYQETIYIEEKAKLKEDNGGVYQMSTNGIPNVSPGKVRLGKDRVRLGKVTKIADASESKDSRIPEVIKLFETVNPSISKYYGNTTQRAACERLLKKWTVDQIRAVVGILPELNATKYAKGKSITPLQLEENLGYIKAFIDQKCNSSKVHKV